MARPRYEAGQTTARETIVQTFWRLLTVKPFSKTSVRELVHESGVNKNTFYYHFQSVEDLAREAVEETLDPRFLSAMLAHATQGAPAPGWMSKNDFSTRVDRMCLIASENSSPELQTMMREAIGAKWQDAFGFDTATLRLQDRLAYEFALGGVMSLFAYRALAGSKFNLAEITETRFASSIAEMLSTLGRDRELGR